MAEALKTQEDGRNRRRNSNRQAILDALLSLYGEGVIEPTAQQVADKAGLSRRTVFGLFQDLNSLMIELVDRHMELNRGTNGLPEPEGTFADRVSRMITRRYEHFLQVQSVLKIVRATAHKFPALRERTADHRQKLRPLLQAYFDAEMAELTKEDREALTSGLVSLLHFDYWHMMAIVQNLPRKEVEQIWTASITGLIDNYRQNSGDRI